MFLGSVPATLQSHGGAARGQTGISLPKPSTLLWLVLLLAVIYLIWRPRADRRPRVLVRELPRPRVLVRELPRPDVVVTPNNTAFTTQGLVVVRVDASAGDICCICGRSYLDWTYGRPVRHSCGAVFHEGCLGLLVRERGRSCPFCGRSLL